MAIGSFSHLLWYKVKDVTDVHGADDLSNHERIGLEASANPCVEGIGTGANPLPGISYCFPGARQHVHLASQSQRLL